MRTEAHRVRHWGLCWTQELSTEPSVFHLHTHPMALFPAWGHFQGQKRQAEHEASSDRLRELKCPLETPQCQEHKPHWDQEILTASSEGLMKGKCVHLLFGAQIALPYDNMHYLICKGQWIALQFLPNACAMNFVIFHTHFSAKNWWYRFEA